MKWLETALDYGISEFEFWNMTIAELQRALNSKVRQKQLEAKEKAIFDYNLADLVARSVARLYSSSATMPELYEIYPTLFDNKEILAKRAEQQAEKSAIRFMQFAQSFNKRFEQKAEEANKT